MAVNSKPCNECMHYDPIKLGDGKKQARRGWCAVKSIYPYKEMEGQLFPPGVKRAAPGEHPNPKIVVGSEVQSHCDQFQAKPKRGA